MMKQASLVCLQGKTQTRPDVSIAEKDELSLASW